MKRSHESGHALLGVLLASLLTALGASTGVQATSMALLQERAQRQRWEALQHLISMVESGPSGEGSVDANQTSVHTLSDGSTLSLWVQSASPSMGDPVGGKHFKVCARWSDPWGVQQVLTLRSFWHLSPRLQPTRPS